MNRKTRYFVIASLLVLTVGIGTGLVAYFVGFPTARYGDTVVLATACYKEGNVLGDFTPLTVDSKEDIYAGGRIPGGFFKREGRPTEKEVLTSRLIDRPLRPSFQKGYRQETPGRLNEPPS